MAKSLYPNGVDSDLSLPRVENNITEIGAESINAVRDAVIAIEDAIGTNPQGNLESLTDRVNNVIDADGNIKSSAVQSIGVFSNISNSQIAANAGIEESKLDLDYPTTSMHGQIVSLQGDVQADRAAIQSANTSTLGHYFGTANRHDGNDVDLVTAIRAKTKVEDAIKEVSDALQEHEEDLSSYQHSASNVTLSNEFEIISADNVQVAIEQIDLNIKNQTSQHELDLHTNGIIENVAAETGTQGNLSIATFATTIFQTTIAKSDNIVHVMRPNAARVTSKNLDLSLLSSSSAYNLRIQAGGINRPYIDINLTSVIPTDNIEDIVYRINVVAHSDANHYPISAYNTDGKLTIAHHMVGEQFTVQILNSVSNSAATALGFADVFSTEFSWSAQQHFAIINSEKIVDFGTSLRTSCTHSSVTTSQINPGVGNLNTFGLDTSSTGKILCNITNHSVNSTYNGTYYIISFPNSSSFLINTGIAHGTFDIEIPLNATSFTNSTSGEIHDIFIKHDEDGYGYIEKSLRASYGKIAGISLKAVNNEISATSLEWKISESSILNLIDGSIESHDIEIPAGFVGQIEAVTPDNVHKMVFEVAGSPENLTRVINVYDFGGSTDSIHVASVHFAGNFGTGVAKYATDKRKFGSAQKELSLNDMSKTELKESLSDLRSNGVVYGLDVISSNTTSLVLRGGRVLIDGSFFDIETREIVLDDLSAATKIIVVNDRGAVLLKDITDPGFSFDDLINNDYRKAVPITEFIVDGALDGSFTDRRLIVGNIDKKLYDVENDLNSQIEAGEINNEALTQALQSITQALDGYTTEVSSGVTAQMQADGCLAFFIGTNILSGDNDLFWDRANNRLGVGTQTQSAKLHVADSSTDSLRGIVSGQTNDATSSAQINLIKDRAGAAVQNADTMGALFFRPFDGTNYVITAGMRATINGTVSTGSVPTDITFITDAIGSLTERMRITSAGKVGIGTNAPPTQLSLASTGESGIRILGNGVTQNASHGVFLGYNGGAHIWNHENSPILIGTNATERMRILGDGNVGIGCTPTTPFHADPGAGGVARIAHISGADNSGPYLEVINQRSDSNKTFGGRIGLSHWRSDGTSTDATTALGAVYFGGPHGGSTTYVDANNLYSAAIIGHAAENRTSASNLGTDLAFYTATNATATLGKTLSQVNSFPGIERMRIAADGKVGIGTLPAALSTLHVYNSANCFLYLDAPIASQSNIFLCASGTGKWQIGRQSYSHDLFIYNQGRSVSDIQIVDATGDTTLLNRVGIGGNPTGTYKLDVIHAADNYAMRIFNDGGTASRAGLEIQCGKDDQTGGSSGTTAYYIGFLDGDGTQFGNITTLNGTVTLGTLSDARTKEDIADTKIDALSVLQQLPVREFRRKTKSKDVKSSLHNAGFIAQECLAVFPDMVGEQPDGTLMIAESRLVPLLVKAIQQLSEEVKQLKARFKIQE